MISVIFSSSPCGADSWTTEPVIALNSSFLAFSSSCFKDTTFMASLLAFASLIFFSMLNTLNSFICSPIFTRTFLSSTLSFLEVPSFIIVIFMASGVIFTDNVPLNAFTDFLHFTGWPILALTCTGLMPSTCISSLAEMFIENTLDSTKS